MPFSKAGRVPCLLTGPARLLGSQQREKPYALSILPIPEEIALCIFLCWHMMNTSAVLFSSCVLILSLSTMKMPLLSLSPPSGPLNLLNMAGVPIAGMGTGLSTSCSPTESTCWLQWKGAMDVTGEECCRLCQLIRAHFNAAVFALFWAAELMTP